MIFEIDNYIQCRLENQIEYFTKSANTNQKNYKILKRLGIYCNVFTSIAIGLIFAIPNLIDFYKFILNIVAFGSSTIVLATYQWEEFHNYGAKWEKFRLIAERLKGEKYLYLMNSGIYANYVDISQKNQKFVEIIEKIIHETDLSYFTLLVDPGKRIEKKLEGKI